ncbi:MAG: DegT/DnrJ/EryC1/StrS family aminotransferase, partial [Bacteroidia bacterium]|nr:DegT/DnrJ/EryC1/StrS family aminotransferase [Bacteroidia bacterium]
MYTDHGHDHIGNDRGAEDHPFLGYNFRISELNAAVGLAQLRRLDDFISIQKRNYHLIRSALLQVDGIGFRRVPETGIPNYSFLNIFLPDEATAGRSAAALKEAGVDSCFYWYDNNWHYYRKWEHFQQPESIIPLSSDMIDRIRERNTNSYPKSDKWMGRNISFLIKLSWSDEEVQNRASKIAEVLRQVLRS